jgi:selenide, water dikinase
LDKLPQITDPRVLVGINTADDAGVIKVNDELALVQTVDIFTPIVDDPYTYGQISAANSLSDVYAMGGKPFSALNIVGFPKSTFPIQVLGEILAGGHDKAAEAGIPIVGGHTITDEELKYGLAVSGFVHPNKVITNSSSKVGDLLVLTKPIGTGAITTRLKAGKGTEKLEKNVCEIMAMLNRDVSLVCQNVGVNACTDITGFGLMGHAFEMAHGSNVSFKLNYFDIPKIDGAMEAVKAGFVPGGSKSNQLYVGNFAEFGEQIGKPEKSLLFDPQTSGGLLISVEEKKCKKLLSEIGEYGLSASIIGDVHQDNPSRITVI